jgi:hypothetical protein
MEKHIGSKEIITAIKDWMKRHAGQPVPGFKEITEGMDVPDSWLTSYTNFKKRAFRELLAEGFKLVYTNDLKTIAYVDGYTPPIDAGQKIVDKIFDDDDLDDCEIPHETKPVKAERKPEDKPDTYVYIHKTGISPRDCAGCADFVAGIASLPENIRLEIKILVKEVAQSGVIPHK